MNGKIDPTPSPQDDREASGFAGIVALGAAAAIIVIGLVYLLQA